MNNAKTHFFWKFIFSSFFIIWLGYNLLMTGLKPKNKFYSTTGKIIYLEKKYNELPYRYFGDFRYLQIDDCPLVFELFIGKGKWDDKPKFEQIDLLKLGDSINIYYDINKNENENEESVNRSLQFIDKGNTPYYIRNDKNKLGGIFTITFGVLLIPILIILKKKGKLN